MQIFKELVPTSEYTAVALGYFDGVHIGHQSVISSAVKCKKQGLTPVVFTFSSTPKSQSFSTQISSSEEKYSRLEKLGVEVLYVIDFDLIKDKSPQDFIKDVVKSVFNAKKVFCGFNYHFGKFGAGNTEDLKKICKTQGIEVGVLDPVLIDNRIISSTTVRALLQDGEVKTANRYLGYDFGYKGKAVRGNRIGTKLGTPTINQQIEKNIIIPKFGVYASVVTIDNKNYVGVTNIGVKPTIEGDNAPLCETWLPEYKGGDLYGKTVDVRLKDFIRPEKKFSGLDELKNAIKADSEKALRIINLI